MTPYYNLPTGNNERLLAGLSGDLFMMITSPLSSKLLCPTRDDCDVTRRRRFYFDVVVQNTILRLTASQCFWKLIVSDVIVRPAFPLMCFPRPIDRGWREEGGD